MIPLSLFVESVKRFLISNLFFEAICFSKLFVITCCWKSTKISNWLYIKLYTFITLLFCCGLLSLRAFFHKLSHFCLSFFVYNIKLIIFFSLAFVFFYWQNELTVYIKWAAVLSRTFMFLTGPADPSLGGDFKNYYKQTCPVIKKQSSSPFIIPFWPRPLTLDLGSFPVYTPLLPVYTCQQ